MIKEIKDKITLLYIFNTFWGWLMFISVNLMLIILLPLIIALTFLFDKNRILPAYIIKFGTQLFYILNFVEKNDTNIKIIKKPKNNEKRIYVINHASMFDVIFMYLLPGPIKSIMKHGYAKLPLIGWISVLSGNVLLNDSGNNIDVFYDVVKKLEKGCPFVIFPEGTKSRDSKISKFHHGSFKIAIDTKSDIVPVVFDTWNVIRPGAFWIRDEKPTLRVLDTIKYNYFKDFDYKTLSNIVRLKMIEALVNLRDERRAKDKNYYRNNNHYIKLDDEMKEELIGLKSKLIAYGIN